VISFLRLCCSILCLCDWNQNWLLLSNSHVNNWHRGYESDGLAFLQLGSSSQAGSTGDNKYMRLCHQCQWKIWQLRSIASESLHNPCVEKIFCDHPLLVCKLFLLKKCTAKCLAFSIDVICLKMKTANLLFTAHNAFILINGKAWFWYLSMLSSTNFKLTHVL